MKEQFKLKSCFLRFVIHIEYLIYLHGDGSNAVVTVNPSYCDVKTRGFHGFSRQELGSRVASKEAVEGAGSGVQGPGCDGNWWNHPLPTCPGWQILELSTQLIT